MKKMLLLSLAVLVLFVAGTLYAGHVSHASAEVSLEAGIAGLPTTVLDQLETQVAFCIRPDIACPDVWDPVTCSNGVTYSNSCYAYLACATGCTSTGGPTS